MRKWLVPLTVLGVGAFFLTDKGRDAVHRLSARFRGAPGTWAEWTEGAQAEVDSIQRTLNQIAASLEPRREA